MRAASLLIASVALSLFAAVPSQAQTNFISNGTFDTDLASWNVDSEIAAWSVVDANGSTTSGSALLTANGSDCDPCYIEGMKQCLVLTPGNTYTVGTKIRIPPGTPGTAEGFIALFFYPTAGCSGYETSSDSTDSVFQSSWKYVSTVFTVPSGAASVSVLLVTRNLPGLKAQFDDIFVKEGVIPPPPQVSFSASPSTITTGQSSTLSWSTNNATSVSIAPDLGTEPVSGTAVVSPSTTTKYTLTAVGPGGTTVATATVNVGPPPLPTIAFAASPSAITAGQTSTLSWQTSDATTATIDNGIGDVPLDGSTIVSPAATTTYTLTATGPGGTRTAQATVTVGTPLPTITFTATPSAISVGQSSTLAWTTTDATSVSIDNGIGAQALSGNVTVSPITTTTYTLTATGPGGTSTRSATVTVGTPAPAISFSANPAAIIAGQSSTLTWTTTNATSVSIDNGVGSQPVNGSVSVIPAATTTYTLTATGPGGSTTAQATVTVGTPAPAATLTATPPGIMTGQSSILTWTTTNATTVSIDNGIGSQPANGSITVTPAVTTTYTLTATGPGGSTTAQATITVTANAPTATISANPATITTGQASILTWATTSATSVSIDNGIGSEPANGSITVTPVATTTYTLTATGPGGSATAQATITVTPPPPSITFTATPQVINAGQSSTLSWTTIYATSVSIDNGIGSQPVSGSISVTPAATTTWTLTATGAGGSRTAQVTVSVGAPPPVIAFTATPPVINAGQTSTLSWTTTNATSVSIDNGIGSQVVNGSISVTPSATTTYTLTATGVGGSRTAQVTVSVGTPPPAVTFTATPEAITTGESSTLAWTTTNSTSVTIDNGLGSRPLNGTAVVIPANTTTYTLTATGPGGSAIAQVTVGVTIPKPTITFFATPPVIAAGQSSTLTWSAQAATHVEIDGGIGVQPLSGSISVAPPSTTTYHLTATGPGGTTVSQATVTVATSACTTAPGPLQILFTGLTSGCTAGGGVCRPGETIAFTAGAPGYSFQVCDVYAWRFSDGTTSSQKDPSRVFAAGQYTVNLSVTNPLGSVSASAVVQVGAGRRRAVRR